MQYRESATGSMFNLAAFNPVPSGPVGNCGVGILLGPGTTTIATGLAKHFQITERLRLRFESTFTNLLNHPNFAPPRQTSLHLRSASCKACNPPKQRKPHRAALFEIGFLICRTDKNHRPFHPCGVRRRMLNGAPCSAMEVFLNGVVMKKPRDELDANLGVRQLGAKLCQNSCGLGGDWKGLLRARLGLGTSGNFSAVIPASRCAWQLLQRAWTRAALRPRSFWRWTTRPTLSAAMAARLRKRCSISPSHAEWMPARYCTLIRFGAPSFGLACITGRYRFARIRNAQRIGRRSNPQASRVAADSGEFAGHD